jgi:hypothetical protein
MLNTEKICKSGNNSTRKATPGGAKTVEQEKLKKLPKGSTWADVANNAILCYKEKMAEQAEKDRHLIGEKGRDVVFKFLVDEKGVTGLGPLTINIGDNANKIKQFKKRSNEVAQAIAESKIPIRKVVFYRVEDPCDAYPERTKVVFDCITGIESETPETLFVTEDIIEYFHATLRTPIDNFCRTLYFK